MQDHIMMHVEQIQAEIEALNYDEFLLLHEWVSEQYWKRWDEQLEADSAAGKLDFLLEEANLAKSQDLLVIREPFDYMLWQRQLWATDNMDTA